MTAGAGRVIAVSRGSRHGIGKSLEDHIELLAGVGVDGDIHAGSTVKHRSRVAVDPTRPNLRQVHLIHEELHDELRRAGYVVGAGQIGENVTTRGIDLLAQPRGTRLVLGGAAIVELTGLRNPCRQLDGLAPGLMKATLARDSSGQLVRKAGVMAVVVRGGSVRPGDPISVEPPLGEPEPLLPV